MFIKQNVDKSIFKNMTMPCICGLRLCLLDLSINKQNQRSWVGRELRVGRVGLEEVVGVDKYDQNTS